MQTYEVQYNGKTYEVQADSAEQAASAFGTADPKDTQQYEAPPPKPDPLHQEGMSGIRKAVNTVGAGIEGVLDTGATLASGALAEPVAGIAGLVSAPFVGMEKANDVIDRTRSLLTHSAWSDVGKWNEQQIGKVAEKVAPAMQWVDDKIGQVAGGDPVIAAALKTAVIGIPSIYGMKGGGKALGTLAEDAETAKSYVSATEREAARIRAKGEKLGIEYNNDQLPASARAAAERLAPERERGANMSTVQTAIEQQAKTDKDAIDNMFEAARAKKAYVDVPAMQAVAAQSQRQFLKNGLDLREMPKVQTRLQQIMDLDRVLPGSAQEQALAMGQRVAQPPYRIKSAGLNNIDVMDKRLTADLAGAKPGNFTAEQKAIYDLRSNLRDALDEQVDNGLIRGDKSVIEDFKKAKEAYALYKENFKSDRIIKKMVTEDASPEQLFTWLKGASAAGMRKEAAGTIERMKSILGPNHPAIQTTKMAFLRDTFQPLFKVEEGKFAQGAMSTVHNIDKLLQENYSTVKALGIDPDELLTLRKSLRAAAEAGPAFKFDWNPITLFVARETVGSEIAKKAAMVKITHKILNSAIRVGKLGQSDIDRLLTQQPFDQPMFNPNQPGFRETMAAIAKSGGAASAATGGYENR